MTGAVSLRAATTAASFRNLLSPAATASRLRMCVAGSENGWDRRLVINSSRNRRFLHASEAVFGPSTSVTGRRRFIACRGATGDEVPNERDKEPSDKDGDCGEVNAKAEVDGEDAEDTETAEL